MKKYKYLFYISYKYQSTTTSTVVVGRLTETDFDMDTEDGLQGIIEALAEDGISNPIFLFWKKIKRSKN